jgi:hypothetical protein
MVYESIFWFWGRRGRRLLMGKEQQQVISAVPTKTNATRTESPHFSQREGASSHLDPC